ncbi:MAG: sigma-70 region 4 domain-containing protein, partial [bacterium]
SENDQEILTLVDWEGFSNRKAALVLGVTPATFGVRLHRARRRLGVALGDGGHRPTRAAMATRKTKEAG